MSRVELKEWTLTGDGLSKISCRAALDFSPAFLLTAFPTAFLLDFLLPLSFNLFCLPSPEDGYLTGISPEEEIRREKS